MVKLGFAPGEGRVISMAMEMPLVSLKLWRERNFHKEFVMFLALQVVDRWVFTWPMSIGLKGSRCKPVNKSTSEAAHLPKMTM
jgi:hypothetical protein